MKITFATGNAHKLKEINEITQKYPPFEGGSKSLISGRGQIEFVLPPEGFDPVEDGETFEENSLIKAREAARLSGMMALADDSGLCVEALNGAPGIHSARYAETAQARIDKLLKALENVPSLGGGLGRGLNRRAKFVCVMTLVDADGKVLFQTRGECHGEIAREQSGVNGFGYDPIFLVEPSPSLPLPRRGKKVTMAELSEEEKNEISHRGKALRKVLEYL
ncbi:MAG: RdgB/HAM1 family non-canonical purine NTP pyrophosphatase, partial [Lachnospiraceae bacterium]|nr:RdgB/HAM1 family non-canonical purine NTP pyrophosphatase [Lachnospiraceae bacterium]